MLRDQGEMFGPVASTPTAWRLLAGIDQAVLARLWSARAAARAAAKTPASGASPSRHFQVNAVWLEMSLRSERQ
ncbi:hypothetical protein ACNPQM_39750 [Streptomyces sp. NPDC056231]|uniref:hypothetical protein n=1 Tax=Streptomyces sp. NPDC056231 TaxID=3345755 RepID=UPI003AAA999B